MTQATTPLHTITPQHIFIRGRKLLGGRGLQRWMTAWGCAALLGVAGLGEAVAHSDVVLPSSTPVSQENVVFPRTMPIPGQELRRATLETGKTIIIYDLGEMVAYPQETKHDFLRRAGQVFEVFTEVSGMEACAKVCRQTTPSSQTGQWALQLTTTYSHIACAVTRICPEGYTPTQENIHVHPVSHKKTTYYNDVDAALPNSRRVTVGRPVMKPFADFSPTDKQVGSGYLVTKGALRYWDGKKIHMLGKVSDGLPWAGPMPWVQMQETRYLAQSIPASPPPSSESASLPDVPLSSVQQRTSLSFEREKGASFTLVASDCLAEAPTAPFWVQPGSSFTASEAFAVVTASPLPPGVVPLPPGPLLPDKTEDVLAFQDTPRRMFNRP